MLNCMNHHHYHRRRQQRDNDAVSVSSKAQKHSINIDLHNIYNNGRKLLSLDVANLPLKIVCISYFIT